MERKVNGHGNHSAQGEDHLVIAIYHAEMPYKEAARLAEVLKREGFRGHVVIALDAQTGPRMHARTWGEPVPRS